MVIVDSNFECLRVATLVPQVPVEGPHLFTIFINDLTRKVRNKSKLYADDSKLIDTI